MYRYRGLVIALALVLALGVSVRAVPEQDESLGHKIKKLFATPTPTPHSRKHSKASPSPSPRHKKPAAKASPSPKASASPSPEEEKSPAAESSRPTASPAETPSPGAHKEKARDEPEDRASSSPSRKHRKSSPPDDRSTKQPDAAESSSEGAHAEKTPGTEKNKSDGEKKEVRTAAISPDRIVGYEKNPEPVRKILDRAVALTNQNLSYKYGSADPASGGLDCSGFIYYVLKESGLKDVPRDAREQYIWVRKAGNFQAVLGHSEDTFELDELQPGDLMFWSGTYRTDKDPAITHTMIYLGREKGSNQRIMVGSSDGRVYKGQSRFGVSVFDFHVATHRRKEATEDQPGPDFVGYGRVPGLD